MQENSLPNVPVPTLPPVPPLPAVRAYSCALTPSRETSLRYVKTPARPVTPSVMELLCAGLVTLVALMVYEPAVLGAVKVVLAPFTLCTGAKEPPAGVKLQVTPKG